jgi:branched-chain amino acid transport system substrate-binding protein
MILDADSRTPYFGRMELRAAILALALAAAPAWAAERPVIVGAVLPQTGMLADLAAEFGRALELWQEQVNAAGGLLGARVRLQLADDGSAAAASAALYERLIREHRADVLLGPFGSGASLVAAGVAERNRRVLVNATGAARAVHKAGYRYVFQVGAPLARYGTGALEVARRAGLTRVTLVARNDGSFPEMAGRAREAALAMGLNADPVEQHAPGTDFAPQILRARASGSEAWIAFGTVQDAAETIKAFRRLDYAPRLFVALGAAQPGLLRLVGQDAEYAIGISPYERTAATRGNADFVLAYRRKWSSDPGQHAAEGYAAARVLEEAVRRAGALDQEKIRAALTALETATPLGPYRVDADGVQSAAAPLLVQIVRGRREIVWPEALASAPPRLPYPAWDQRKPLGKGD